MFVTIVVVASVSDTVPPGREPQTMASASTMVRPPPPDGRPAPPSGRPRPPPPPPNAPPSKHLPLKPARKAPPPPPPRKSAPPPPPPLKRPAAAATATAVEPAAKRARRGSVSIIAPTVLRDLTAFDEKHQVGQGTYGSVFVGQDKITREIFALKRINTEQEENGFPITAIREVKILKALKHPNIVNMKEIVTSKGTSFVSVCLLVRVFVRSLRKFRRSKVSRVAPLFRHEVTCSSTRPDEGRILSRGVSALHFRLV